MKLRMHIYDMASTADVSDLRDRVSRLEGGYEHLATKADLKDMQIKLGALIIAVGGLVVAILRLWQ